jgi:anti-sigma factor RsiW
VIRLRLRRRRSPNPLACREFVELVSDYLEGTLPPDVRARVDAHLAECDACTGYLEDVRMIATTLPTIELPETDPATHAALLAAFRDAQRG